jgi:hypothetical protein
MVDERTGYQRVNNDHLVLGYPTQKFEAAERANLLT